jgi:protein NRD1
VQSCIVNQDKRHAFIKMLTREDAVKAKSGMETYRTDNMTLRVSGVFLINVGECYF